LYSSSHYPRSYIPPTQRDAFNASAYLSESIASSKAKLPPLSSSLHSQLNGQLPGHNGIVGPPAISQDKHEVPIKSIHNNYLDRQPYQSSSGGGNPMLEQQQQLVSAVAAYQSFSKEKENKEKLQQSQIEHNNNNSIIANKNNSANSNHNQNISNNSDKGFKIPSGKEGSLKHRILTRPYGTDRDGRRKSPPTKVSTTVFK
jgi:hypothetical protein